MAGLQEHREVILGADGRIASGMTPDKSSFRKLAGRRIAVSENPAYRLSANWLLPGELVVTVGGKNGRIRPIHSASSGTWPAVLLRLFGARVS